ncbi:MAG: hypothetical protein NTY98_05240 [Verrucomicrobia bacterium]|nr:hypothetical protein [Verrucomicrobiota bacterium]
MSIYHMGWDIGRGMAILVNSNRPCLFDPQHVKRVTRTIVERFHLPCYLNKGVTDGVQTVEAVAPTNSAFMYLIEALNIDENYRPACRARNNGATLIGKREAADFRIRRKY